MPFAGTVWALSRTKSPALIGCCHFIPVAILFLALYERKLVLIVLTEDIGICRGFAAGVVFAPNLDSEKHIIEARERRNLRSYPVTDRSRYAVDGAQTIRRDSALSLATNPEPFRVP